MTSIRDCSSGLSRDLKALRAELNQLGAPMMIMLSMVSAGGEKVGGLRASAAHGVLLGGPSLPATNAMGSQGR
jgi:hypothetical protein